MKKIDLAARAAFCLALAAALPLPASADGDQEILAPHPMAVYQASVPEKGGVDNVRLSKDSLGMLRAHFKSRLQPGDRIEEFSRDDEEGFSVVYAKKVGKKELRVTQVTVTARADKAAPHQAFGELSNQVRMGRHSEAEFKLLQNEHAGIESAYFRRAAGAPGKGSEADLILERAHKAAHPDGDKLKAAGKNHKVSEGDKAEAKELKRKMKELKAQGDIAGMMALAQSNKKFQGPPAGMEDAARMAAEDRNRDTWDIWVKCLKDTSVAAYRTRLVYAPAAIRN